MSTDRLVFATIIFAAGFVAGITAVNLTRPPQIIPEIIHEPMIKAQRPIFSYPVTTPSKCRINGLQIECVDPHCTVIQLETVCGFVGPGWTITKKGI